MSGKDKGLIPYKTKPMVQWVSEALRPFTRKILVSSNQSKQEYSQYGDAVFADLIEGFKGPLSGLYTLLSNTEADYLLTSTCDTPLLNQEYAPVMLSALEKDIAAFGKGALIYCAKSQEKIQPLHLLVSPILKENLGIYIASERLRVMDWIFEQSPRYVEFSDSDMFRNFNQPEDLQPEV